MAMYSCPWRAIGYTYRCRIDQFKFIRFAERTWSAERSAMPLELMPQSVGHMRLCDSLY